MITALIIDAFLVVVLLILIFIKTAHFKKYISTKRRTLVNWVYFDHKTVIRSHSSKSIDNKRKQNSYSVRIGVVLLAIVCAIILEVIMLDQPLPGSVKPSERPTAPTIKR